MTSNLLLKLSRQLYDNPSDRQSFIDAILQPAPLNSAILWTKDYQPKPFPCLEPFPWQPDFTDRLSSDIRPGKHPLHDQGFYYCLDLSSVFAASVLLAVPKPVETVIDLCAAPGGKSIFAWRVFQPSKLYANEVIGKRSAALIANLKRCGITNWEVCQLDVKVFAQNYVNQGDVVIVDAPCSGQSLLVKKEKNEGCFHPVMIKHNAQRQRRILANAAPIVKTGGYLAYMTCTYSPEENEETLTWLLQKFPAFVPISVPTLAAHQSHLTDIPCYRLMPQTQIGAGAFTALLQKN